MKYYYSPYTKELINTNNPADWMSFTGIVPEVDCGPSESVFFDEENNIWYTKASEPTIVYKTIFSVREFRNKFSLDEQMAIREASLIDMEVGLVHDEFQSAQFIDLDDPSVESGLNLYVEKSLISEERKAEILKPEEVDE